MFLNANRNKRSIVADLKSDEGRDTARALAAASDVVIQNFRPGVVERLGTFKLDPAAWRRWVRSGSWRVPGYDNWPIRAPM